MRALLRQPYARRRCASRLIVAVAAASSCRRPSICASRRSFSSSRIAVVGLNLLMGFAGQVSLGHAGFFGIGAYAVAVGPTHLGVPSLDCAHRRRRDRGRCSRSSIGRPILKLKGHYLAVATLGLGILIAMVFTNEARFTGGPDGMPVPRLELFGWRARGSIAWYWISGVTLVHRRADRRQPDREPDRPRLARHPRQRDRRARARHRRRALQADRRSCSRRSTRRSPAPISRCSTALVTPVDRRFPALDRIRHHGGARRARLDPRQHRRRGGAGRCCRRC